MKRFIILLFIAFSVSGYAQNAKNEAPVYNTTYYQFKVEGVTDQNKLNDCVEAVKQIKMVNEAKAKFKPESKVAELIIVVAEKARRSESDEEFSLSEVKKTIIRYGFTPSGFTVRNPQSN
ncbi:MAG: hypothetical protein ACXVPN_03075 [Bacteroidia bacterium]